MITTPLSASSFVPYFTYAGALAVAGTVYITTEGTTQTLTYTLTAVDPACGAGSGAAANSCGIHIHSGTTCTENAGGHLYTAGVSVDPWATVSYTSEIYTSWPDATTYSTSGSVTITTGATAREILGHVLIVHAHDASRIACALIADSSPTQTAPPPPPPTPRPPHPPTPSPTQPAPLAAASAEPPAAAPAASPAPPASSPPSSVTPHGECSAAGQRCWETRCCADERHGCFKSVGKRFALCRVVPAEPCTSNEHWECPGTWEPDQAPAPVHHLRPTSPPSSPSLEPPLPPPPPAECPSWCPGWQCDGAEWCATGAKPRDCDPCPPAPPPLPVEPPPSPRPILPRVSPEELLHPSSASWRRAAGLAMSLRRLDAFYYRLTAIVPAGERAGAPGEARVVLSSGGAAGGVISEGQGYGLLLSSLMLAALPADHERRIELTERAYATFLGWRTMGERTAKRRRLGGTSCQTGPLCGEGARDGFTPNPAAECPSWCPGWQCDGAEWCATGAKPGECDPCPRPGSAEEAAANAEPIGFPCLPSWKFDNQAMGEVGTGSAPDGDEDAILGMIVLLLATKAQVPRPTWWLHLARWAYQSCHSFLVHSTQPHPTRLASNGRPERIVKLGSCWGGWDCLNPSYLAPAHYRVFRLFMDSHGAVVGSAASAAQKAEISSDWEALIETSYSLLDEAQCAPTGLVPNWWVAAQGELPTGAAAQAREQWHDWRPGSASCSGSGTPAAEFGSEAGRTLWRVALDAIWFGSGEAARFSRAVGAHVVPKLAHYDGVAASSAAAGSDAAASASGAVVTAGALHAHDEPRRMSLGTCTAPETCEGLRLETPSSCAVTSVHANWTGRAFMLTPIAAALMVPPLGDVRDPGRQALDDQSASLDIAAVLLSQMPVDEYYDGAWVALGTLTLTGTVHAAAPLFAELDTTPPKPWLAVLEAALEPSRAASEEVPLVRWVLPAAGVLFMLACLVFRRATGPGGGVVLDIAKKLRPGRAAGDEYERQPLSETQGVCDTSSMGESGESAEPEWVMHYDRTGRPYWSDGVTSTWKKPHSYRPV